jgi:hypothetical protein
METEPLDGLGNRGRDDRVVVVDQKPMNRRPKTRGIRRKLAGWLRALGQGRAETDWLAVAAVFCEPVSGRNSLLKRENTGNLLEFGAFSGGAT